MIEAFVLDLHNLTVNAGDLDAIGEVFFQYLADSFVFHARELIGLNPCAGKCPSVFGGRSHWCAGRGNDRIANLPSTVARYSGIGRPKVIAFFSQFGIQADKGLAVLFVLVLKPRAKPQVALNKERRRYHRAIKHIAFNAAIGVFLHA